MPHEAIDTKSMERRRGIRVSRVVAVRHRLIRRIGCKRSSEWSLSTTKNMSHSGLLFFSHVPYRKNDMLEVQVVMSGVIDIYCGQAQVVRVTEIGHTSFDVAVKYLPPKAKTRKARTHLKK